jgi:integrase
MTLQRDLLSTEEVEALIRACGRGSTGARNRAIVATLYATGLRVGELVALRPSDVQDGVVRVQRGKGGRARAVRVLPFADGHLAAWRLVRSGLGAGPRDPLFCSVSKGTIGRGIHPSNIRRLLPSLAARAGIEKRVHPHALRHSLAARLARDVPINTVREQLGHASLSTTTVYLSRITAGEALEPLDGFTL